MSKMFARTDNLIRDWTQSSGFMVKGTIFAERAFVVSHPGDHQNESRNSRVFRVAHIRRGPDGARRIVVTGEAHELLSAAEAAAYTDALIETGEKPYKRELSGFATYPVGNNFKPA